MSIGGRSMGTLCTGEGGVSMERFPGRGEEWGERPLLCKMSSSNRTKRSPLAVPMYFLGQKVGGNGVTETGERKTKWEKTFEE